MKGYGYVSPTRIRIDTLLTERGMKWSEVYSKLGLDKVNASKIRNGLVIPKLKLKLDIAKIFGIDTAVIWGGFNYDEEDEEENDGEE